MASRRSLPWLLWLLSGSVIACSAVGSGTLGTGLGDSGAGTSRDAGRGDGAANRSDSAAATSNDGGRADVTAITPGDAGVVGGGDGGAPHGPDAGAALVDGGMPVGDAGPGCGPREVCGNGVDDDCDGMIDEGCACAPGETRACYSGSTSTRGVGTCRAGTQTCAAREGGSDWGPCMGEVVPETDRCDGMDRDCDGNPNTGCVCVVGTMRSCYSATPSTVNVGLCRAGVETCMRDKMSGQTGWGACAGEVIPGTDRCDGMDRDCDGNPNTGCACTLGATRPCYGGPTGTQDVGICRAGTQRCDTVDGAAAWTACAGETRPGTEVCGNAMDDNCNGAADEGCVTCAAPRRMCPSGCVDVLTDRNNCGACGNVCPSGQACANGICVGDGMLRVTMVWNLAGDMDLHVVPPCGAEISYRARSQCGGQLDRDDTSGTGPENVFWTSSPPRGTYLVCATPYSIRGATPFTVTVNQGTTVLRRWTGTRTSSSSYVLCSRTSPYFLGDFTL